MHAAVGKPRIAVHGRMDNSPAGNLIKFGGNIGSRAVDGNDQIGVEVSDGILNVLGIGKHGIFCQQALGVHPFFIGTVVGTPVEQGMGWQMAGVDAHLAEGVVWITADGAFHASSSENIGHTAGQEVRCVCFGMYNEGDNQYFHRK